MLDEHNNVPLYIQLFDILKENIDSGKWPVNHKLPSENELGEAYSVSRITVRKALEKLESGGYLYRKRGKGTFVTTPPIEQHLSFFYSISDMSTKSHKPTTQVRGFDVVPCDSEIAPHLNIAPKTLVYQIERLRLADNLPLAHEYSYVPVAMFPELNGESIQEIGLYKSFEKYENIVPDSALEWFEAIIIDSQTALLLEVGDCHPGMLNIRVASAAGKPVEYCRSIVRGDRIKYQVSLGKL